MPIADDVCLNKGVIIQHPNLVNLYGCTIGEGSSIGPFVEIQRDVVVGRLCKISSHTFICSGVIIADEVFIGHGVIFTNDLYPQAARNGNLLRSGDWELRPIHVEYGASIGSGAIILPGVSIGRGAVVGAGSVVTCDVPDLTVVAGVPARVIKSLSTTDDC
ncbi:MAG: acyltransferase [Desulfosporosinus sp.]|nr:acyltransferase [Desulfosporosinus sp.]